MTGVPRIQYHSMILRSKCNPKVNEVHNIPTSIRLQPKALVPFKVELGTSNGGNLVGLKNTMVYR